MPRVMIGDVWGVEGSEMDNCTLDLCFSDFSMLKKSLEELIKIQS